MRGLYIAESAMLVQQAQLQTISNNLSNLRSTGYKSSQNLDTSFAEWMVYELRPAHENGRSGMLRPLGTAAHSVATQSTSTFMGQGPLEVTERPLDFAIMGDGFFQVQGEEGVLYTRNGRFMIDQEGYLVTIEGYQVLGEGGPINIGTDDISSDREGGIFANGEEVGRLVLAFLGPDSNLERQGYNYFNIEGAGQEGEFEIIGGFLEGSNVDLSREMANVMIVRRSYEAAQKIMTTYDQLLDKAANDLAVI